MELAINSFSQGLQLDTHPMVLGNNTMTDCLNGTLITMNGNETILQNDMGNRRVDNAFLPAGYEPVGIKEYGGIIYIAAYNPITNRSQVGSFPSPERRIGIYDDDLGGNISPEQFTAHPIEDLNKLFCLDSDTIQIPLTDKTSLHAGDKFVVYHQGYDEWFNKENLSNYDNIFYGENNEEKIYSPKNKKYSAQIGILNSLNTFVDITKSLCRWNTENGLYIDTSNKPDLYKFNVGYFIKNLSSNEMSAIAIKDKQFLDERELNKASVNTYAYKLVGPMYMLLKVNHILSFDYNIWGSFDKNNNNTLTLTVEGIATYNCPDSLIEGINGGNDTYKTFELLENFIDNANIDNYIMFDLFRCVDDDDRNIHENVLITQLTDNDQLNEFYSLKKGVFTYDEVSNLYTARITKEYVIKNFEEDIFNYVIGVRTPININGNPTYLSGLSTKGQININLLGSGDTNARRWQFLYKNSEITLKYNFDFYPKPDEKITNLIATLKNVENLEDTRKIILFENISTGSQGKTIKINGLTPKALYKAELSYTVNSNVDSRYEHDEFILTTPLFNDCFDRGNSQILDYGWPGGVLCNTINSSTNIDDEGISKEIKTFKEKLRILPYISVGVDSEGMEIKEDLEGSFIKKGTTGDLIEIEYTLSINPVFTIQDNYFRIKDLYPNYIKPIESVQMKISNCRTNIDIIKSNIEEQLKNPSNINNHISETLNYTNNSINLKLKWKDFYKSNSISYNGKLYNVFDSVENYIDEHFDYNRTEITQISCPTVVLIIGKMQNWHNDRHFVVVGRLGANIEKNRNLSEKLKFYNVYATQHEFTGEHDDSYDHLEVFIGKEDKIFDHDHDGEYIFRFIDINGSRQKELLKEALIKNSAVTPNELEPIFLYAFEDSSSGSYARGFIQTTSDKDDFIKTIKDKEGGDNKLASRVWWRTSDLEYILIDKILNPECTIRQDDSITFVVTDIEKESVKNYFKNIFKTSKEKNINNIMFCRYKELDLLGYICPAPQNNQVLENSYICSIPYEILVTFSPLNSSILNLVTISNYGILNFYSEGNTITERKEILPEKTIKSNNKYIDLIINGAMDNYRKSNIDLEGNHYSQTNVIYNRQGEKIECNYVNMRIDNINSNEYLLVYKNNSNLKNTIQNYKCDYFQDYDKNDTETVLDYTGIEVFNPPIK